MHTSRNAISFFLLNGKRNWKIPRSFDRGLSFMHSYEDLTIPVQKKRIASYRNDSKR